MGENDRKVVRLGEAMAQPGEVSRSFWSRVRRAAGALGAGVLLGLVVPGAHAGAAAADKPFDNYSGRVQGVGIRQVYGAAGAQADPGTASSFANVNSVPGFGGTLVDMKAAAINADPGTLAGAVLFAPPDCSAQPPSSGCLESGGYAPGAPDTGLASPAGFPGYAEAFFPEPDQPRAQKCLANKDAKADETCSQASGGLYADAQVNPKAPNGPLAQGLASSQGYSSDMLSGESVVSRAAVGLDDKGSLRSEVESVGNGLAIAGTPVVIKGFRAAAFTVAARGGASGDASCTVDVTANGQPIPISQVQAALDGATSAIGAASPVSFRFTPPSPKSITTTADGGVQAECTGAVLDITYRPPVDLSGVSGQPIPDTSTSVRYVFGQAYAVTSQLTQSPEFTDSFDSGFSAGFGDGSDSTIASPFPTVGPADAPFDSGPSETVRAQRSAARPPSRQRDRRPKRRRRRRRRWTPASLASSCPRTRA